METGGRAFSRKKRHGRKTKAEEKMRQWLDRSPLRAIQPNPIPSRHGLQLAAVLLLLTAVLLLLAALAGVAAARDIVHQDDEAPNIPGCNNDFVLVRLSGPLLVV
jgi:hypothetical protein